MLETSDFSSLQMPFYFALSLPTGVLKLRQDQPERQTLCMRGIWPITQAGLKITLQTANPCS